MKKRVRYQICMLLFCLAAGMTVHSQEESQDAGVKAVKISAAGQETEDPAAQGAADPAGQNTADPAAQGAADPAAQNAAAPAGQNAADPAAQGAVAPAAQNAADSAEQDIQIVCSVKNLPYIGGKKYDLGNAVFSSDGYVSFEQQVIGAGVISTLRRDFNRDGREDILAVTYEPSQLMGEGERSLRFVMLCGGGEEWKVTAETEIVREDYDGMLYDPSPLGSWMPLPTECSVFVRHESGEYQFFCEFYSYGLWSDGSDWALMGYRFDGTQFSGMPETENMSFIGSEFTYMWQYAGDPSMGYDESYVKLVNDYGVLGFKTRDGLSFESLTAAQNPQTLQIAHMVENTDLSPEEANRWYYEDHSAPLSGFWCRVEGSGGGALENPANNVQAETVQAEVVQPETVQAEAVQAEAVPDSGDTDGQTQSGAQSGGEYLIPDSGSRYLDEADIAGMSSDEIQRAVNEVYARHGKIFSKPENDEYFRSKSWYAPVSGKTDEEIWNEFNDYERKNVEFMAQFIKEG